MRKTRDHHRIPDHLQRYVGLTPWLEDPKARARHRAFTLLTESLARPDTPFGRVMRCGTLLHEQTRELLYAGDFGYTTEPYVKGSRPILEQWVARCVRPGMSEGDIAIALSQSLDGLPRVHPKPPAFLYGESDEHTILKGGGHCSCRSRLLCALCQVAGLQARPAMMWAWADETRDPDKVLGGHTVAEVLINGRWGFFDPQHHCYCKTADGSFPSIAEVQDRPELFTRMPSDVIEAMKMIGYRDALPGMNDFEYYWYKNFNPKCPICISHHDVNEPGTPYWTWASSEFRAKQLHDYTLYQRMLMDWAQGGQLTEDIYRLPVDRMRAALGITDAQLPVFASDEATQHATAAR